MGSKPRSSMPNSERRLRTKPSKQPCSGRRCRQSTRLHGGGASVSDKLEALRELIPSQQRDEAEAEAADVIKPDKLYKETAEYIVRLKAQILVLQKLVEHYGSTSSNNNDNDYDDDVDREIIVNPDVAV